MTSKGRLEAFTDAILAIAITLLSLDLNLPESEAGKPLGEALLHHWPSYLAYVVSFLVIGIIWINHHAMFALIARVERGLLFLNLLLMLIVAAIPFAAGLFADNLTSSHNSHIAAALYSGLMVAMSLCFIALWHRVITHPELLHGHVDVAAARGTSQRFGMGILVYVGTVGLSFVNGMITLFAHLVIALYYCFDQLSVRGTTQSADEAT